MISVVIPCHNCEDYIEEAVHSVVNCDMVLEIVCVENSSADNTWLTLQKLKAQYPRKVILERIEQANVSLARNKGAEISNGKYIIFLDSDDYLQLQDIVGELEEALELEPDYMGFPFTTNVDELGRSRGFVKEFLKYKEYLKYVKGKIPTFQFRSCLINRKLMIESGVRFVENLKIGEDTLFTIKYLAVCRSFVYFPNVLYYYRIHPLSTMHFNPNSLNKLKQRFEGLQYAVHHLDAHSKVSFLNITMFKQAMEVAARLYNKSKDVKYIYWMIKVYLIYMGVRMDKKMYYFLKYLKYAFK